jgi:hypothetical protein
MFTENGVFTKFDAPNLLAVNRTAVVLTVQFEGKMRECDDAAVCALRGKSQL